MPVKLPSKTEFKTCTFKVADVDSDQGIVTGYLSTWELDLGNGFIRDRVRSGAFRKTILESKARAANRGKRFLLPHLWMHSPEQPLGGYIDMVEDSHGLKVAFELDLSTNAAGYPNNPTATMVFSGHKRGYIDCQSIGYEVIQSEMVEEMVDGKKTMVRDLVELRLLEGSSVTSGFSMNPGALDTSVKSRDGGLVVEINGKRYAEIPEQADPDTGLFGGFDAKDIARLVTLDETKATICGSTSGPIGPRDEAWDGAAAKTQIFTAASNADGSLNPATCKKYFMLLDGDPQLKASWGYPFWFLKPDPHICVGAVKAIAGLAQGARGASTPDGIKGKVAALYSKINSKYPDSTPLTPPWQGDSDSGKSGTTTTRGGRAMAGRSTSHFKTFAAHLAEEMCEDLLGDWAEVYLDALTDAVEDALRIGDTASADISSALDDFKGAVMSGFVAQAEQFGLSAYLTSHEGAELGEECDDEDEDDDDDDDGGPGGMPAISYGVMAARMRRLGTKAGRRISAATVAALQDHADAITAQAKSHAGELTKAATSFVDRMRAARGEAAPADAEDATDGGADEDTEDGSGSPKKPSSGGKTAAPGTTDSALAEHKRGAAISAATMGAIADHAESIKTLASANVKAVRSAANALSALWNEEGIGPAYADDAKATPNRKGKTTTRRGPQHTAAPSRDDAEDADQPGHGSTDADDDANEVEAVLARMQALTTTVTP